MTSREYQHQYYRDHAEKIKKYTKDWLLAHPEYGPERAKRRRAERKQRNRDAIACLEKRLKDEAGS